MTKSLEVPNGQAVVHEIELPTEFPIAFAASHTTPVPLNTVTNGDEQLDFGGAQFIGNFHKTLPRRNNGTGEVDPASYVAFANIADNDGDFEFTAASTGASKLTNPQAGRATEQIGPDPSSIHMLPAPSVLSDSTAAEMVELYWMAELRDLEFHKFATNAKVGKAIDDIAKAYRRALTSETHTVGDVRLGYDLPVDATGVALAINAQTVFRVGLPDEDKGPLVSQFFLQDINYGAQLIKATQVPYKKNKDYLTTFPEWLKAQRTGRDNDGNDYPSANNFSANAGYYETTRRRIQTMRDLARFVNRDALHQAYFNAALQLGNLSAKADPGNPYGLFARQVPFGTLGGPHLLALVSEVASRALHVVWHQKWTHRRLRPEAYGGLLHVQEKGVGSPKKKRQYGLPTWPFDGYLADTGPIIKGSNYFLPMAFTSGSPAHPAYGAGHATVAGACVTILKAWFDDTQTYQSLLMNAPPSRDPSPYYPDNPPPEIWNPGTVAGATDRCQPYTGADVGAMTVGGELNKLAANVAMGRTMGGVHWRTDNTRSLRLGEQISTIILSQLLPTLPEKPSLSYTNFDGNRVTIASDGTVTVPNDPGLQAFYVGPF